MIKKFLLRPARSALCLTALFITPACRAVEKTPSATPKEFAGATPLQ
jgi:hypothetical protein